MAEREAFEAWWKTVPIHRPLAHLDAWAAWNARAAITANAPAVPDAQAQSCVPAVQDVANLLSRLERQWHRMGELWERCQGKGWPVAESREFSELRDVRSPDTRAALLALLAAPPQPQPVQPTYTADEIAAAGETGFSLPQAKPEQADHTCPLQECQGRPRCGTCKATGMNAPKPVAQPERVPLTETQKNAMWVCVRRSLGGGEPEDYYMQGIADAESEHGITKKE